MAVARAAALLLLATGCNAVFGIERTELPPPDALPTSCPALGSAPRYSGTFRQVVVEDCEDYSPSLVADVAMARCLGEIYAGKVAAPLAKIAITPLNLSVILEEPRVLPEGNVAYIDNNNFDDNGGDRFEEYDSPDAGATWNRIGDSGLPHGTGAGAWIGTLTPAPNRHVMWTNGSDGTLHELVQQTATWTELPTTTGLGITEIYDPANLTPDGLHLIVHERLRRRHLLRGACVDRRCVDGGAADRGRAERRR